jgi:ergothioneine biosynthesis protein EgtB
MTTQIEHATHQPDSPPLPAREGIRAAFDTTRALSATLSSPLSPEDQQVQSMPDVSPTKWHLAHTTWFFETLLLRPHLAGYREFHKDFNYLFNSYYESIGDRQPRSLRGLISRPTLAEVLDYRAHVDEAMRQLMQTCSDETWREIGGLIELGVHHEQQHQELILTDIKHVLSCNPMAPSYLRDPQARPAMATTPLQWHAYEGGVHRIGAEAGSFCYDNELPSHKVYLEDFRLASRLVTNGEFLEFIQADGYHQPTLWLSDGWYTVQNEQWQAPLYWQQVDGQWHEYTMRGLEPLELNAPVTHVSYFESEAYAAWRGRRLPSEAEWEIVAAQAPTDGNLMDATQLHPRPAPAANGGPAQLYGDVWEWTGSPYAPYPGFRIAEGAVGEYNGKFMCNQYVLRGGSCATPQGHVRPTYRNFFPAHARWQFSGIRLAEDA